MRLGRAAAVALVLGLGGCTSLQAVNTASNKLLTASKNWNEVANELDATCERQRQYNRAEDCTRSAAITQRVAAANAVLTNYFQALADTANDQNYTVQPGLDALGKTAGEIPGVGADKASAASALVSLLAKWATEAAREKALRELVGGGVPSAKTVIGLVGDQLSKRLQSDLGGEQDEMDKIFLNYIYPSGGVATAQLHSMCKEGPPAYALGQGPFLAALEYCGRSKDLDAKTQAVNDYSKSLETAAKTLDDLASSKSKLTAKDLINQLYKDGKDLDAKTAAVSKAFNAGASK